MIKSNYKVVALLPMKANSVRVRGKNFRDFLGRPLFYWVLETLLEVDVIDEIVINTDAKKIISKYDIVINDKVMLRERKKEICGDHISMNLVIEDDVSNVSSDIYLMTHVTNPLISASTIRSAITSFIEAMDEGTADSLFTVDRVQTRFYREDCSPINHDPKNLIPTQDLEPWFEENSNLYIFTAESFSKTKARIGERPMMYESPKVESIDIDTPEDWDMAIVAAHYLKEKGEHK